MPLNMNVVPQSESSSPDNQFDSIEIGCIILVYLRGLGSLNLRRRGLLRRRLRHIDQKMEMHESLEPPRHSRAPCRLFG